MFHKSLLAVFFLLFLNSCGRGETTAYRASFYLPAEGVTLADKNRHELLASSQLEMGIHYQTPEPGASQEPQAEQSPSPPKTKQTSEKKQLIPVTEENRSPAAPVSERVPATGFSLRDQKGQTFTYQFPRPRVTVLAFADREGSAQMENWIRPLYSEFTEQIDIHGIADLSAVPRFARGIAQGIISGLVKYPVMLDWEGKVSRAYQVEAGKTTLVVITPEGYIYRRLSGTASPEKLQSLIQSVRELLPS